MASPFVGYDLWLERPHQDRIAEWDAYLEWCEEEELDPDEEESEELWQKHIEESVPW